MTTIVIDLSEDKLLKLKEIATQLGVAPEELARSSIEEMLIRRNEASDANTEADLLRKIKQALPPEVERRFRGLNAKRWAETLTPDEHGELLDLIERVETMQVERIKYLAELARLRKTSITELMDSLGIRPRPHE